MSDPFLGEIKLYGFGWPPHNWALCDGQSLPIAQNQALYSLTGSTFGGDGRVNFKLPDLRGRVPVHEGSIGQYDYVRGQTYGTETVNLSESTLPQHTHQVIAAEEAPDAQPNYQDAFFSNSADLKSTSPGFAYRSATNLTAMNPSTVSLYGNTEPHNNVQPSLVLSFCIALDGAYPPRS